MINLHRLVEKQEKTKQVIKVVKIWFIVALIFFMFVHLFTFTYDTDMSMLICTFIVFLASIVTYFVECYHLSKTTKQIIMSITRIIESSIESQLCEDSLAFVDCYKHDDKYFYFSIEIYDDVITYDTLASFAEPLAEEINSIIRENFISLYRIERTEELSI